MRKLRLDVDALTVDSFEATAPAKQEGTVHGQQLNFTIRTGCCGSSFPNACFCTEGPSCNCD